MTKSFDLESWDEMAEFECPECGESLWSGSALCPNCDASDLEIDFVTPEEQRAYQHDLMICRKGC
jgi:hypothetical protein